MSFEASLSSVTTGPFLGLDWGKKRFGVAISDPENMLAMPLVSLEAHRGLSDLHKLWNEYHPKALVIGWPVHMNSQRSETCDRIEKFMEKLPQEWPVFLWDERLTTQSLEALAPFGVRPDLKDAHAAAVILQSALHRWRHFHPHQETIL
jgi:putative Holliday junction resolvase